MKRYIYKIRLYMFIQILCDALFTLAFAFIPYFQKLLVDMVVEKEYNFSSFSRLVMLYIGCIVGGLILSYISNIYVWKGAITFEKSLKKDFFKSLFKSNYKEFSSKDIGEYISIQGNDITHLEQDYLQPLTDLFKSANMLIIYGFILFVYIDWRIAITILSSSIFTVAVARITSKVLSTKRNIYLEQVGKYVSRIKDLLEGFKLIESRTRNNFINEHENVLQKTADKRLSYGKFKTLTMHINDLTTGLTGVLAFVVVGVLLANGEITVGTVVATFGYIHSFLSPIESILYDITSISSLKETKKKVLDSIDIVPTNDLKTKETFNRDIVFDKVSCRYEEFSVEDLSLKFENGKKYALIGHSGSGKSTILNMLMKYTEIHEGNIFIDGENLNSIDTSHIMYNINQDEHVFADSFVNNATVYSSYSVDNLNNITGSLNVKAMKTVTEKENCKLLSGGEKQILGFVRMLTSNGPICLMDEAFSAVDMNTEQILRKVLMSMNDKTIIMVTHKLSQDLRMFDRVILMENGRVVQQGFYDEVSETEEFVRLRNM